MSEVSECLVPGVVVPGYQVASGQSSNSPYPQGTIALQTPHFQSRGLDLSPFFAGTLNVSIAPQRFKLLRSDYTFAQVKWLDTHAPETFSFCHCHLVYGQQAYGALVYYPHPETKLGHFQNDQTLEILAPPIADITYGDHLSLALHPHQIQLLSE
jgi:hypothetical protein